MSTTLEPPASDEIRRAVAEVLVDPKFKIGQDTRTGETIVDLIFQLLEWVITPLRLLFEAMEGLPEGLRWVVVVGLVILLLLLVGHIIYTITSTLRPSIRNSKFTPTSTLNKAKSAEEFEQLSLKAITSHDYISAVRFLFKASLVHLQTLEGRMLSPGLTNWQYVRRYRKSRFGDSLRYFAHVIDAGWYGNGTCQEEEYLKCREAYAEIKRHSKDNSHADNA